mgnify:CR=1 FL=1
MAEDLHKLRLWVYVDEADVGAVSIGQNASFTVSAYLSRSYPARITRVGFGSTITDNVVTYKTILLVNNDDLALRASITATAAIVTAYRDSVLQAAREADDAALARARVYIDTRAARGDGGGAAAANRAGTYAPGTVAGAAM